MHNKIAVLALVALLQLVVIAWFWFGSDAETQDSVTLLSFDTEQVDLLTISSPDSQVQIKKTEQGWRVTDAPADDEKVTTLLDKLAGLQAPWPVATSADVAQRFEVAEDNYQRLVSLRQGDEILAQAYLGTSPGYQRVHARAAGQDDVYSVQLSNYELGLEIDAWLDKAVMAIDETVTRVDYVPSAVSAQLLEQVIGEDGAAIWQINGESADATKAETYVNRFGNLRVLGLADDKLVSQATLVAQLTVQTASESYVYEILATYTTGSETDTVQTEADQAAPAAVGEQTDTAREVDNYLIRRQGVSQVYRLATYVAEQLLMQDTDFISI